MAKIYCVLNQKGGVGKTSVCINLASGLAKRGFKVLAIDLDSQGCLSSTFKAKKDNITILDMFLADTNIKYAIQQTEENVDVVPAHWNLALNIPVITEKRDLTLLKKAIERVKAKYDYIILDCSPALDTIVLNALVSANRLIIPILPDGLSQEGIAYLMESVTYIKNEYNKNLKIAGLLLTMYDNRILLSRKMADLSEEIAKSIDTKLFKTRIRPSVKMRESQAREKSIFSYAPTSKLAEDYNSFIDELLEDEKA